MLQFILYRILGNDLPPRHAVGQTLANLTFTLEHEPPLARCEKRWVVNRTVDPRAEAALIALLERHEQKYLRIPFIDAEYLVCNIEFDDLPPKLFLYRKEFHALPTSIRLRLLEWCFRQRNRYLMNNNGARNAALRQGRGQAEWVMPFDGNCFFTSAAWKEVLDAIELASASKYLIVPMARVLENERLLDPSYRPEATEEPQIAFRHDASEVFDERLRYGAMSKSSLLHRIGVPGPWLSYGSALLPWEKIDLCPSPEAGQYVQAGWVARLFSGHREAEINIRARFHARLHSIIRFCQTTEEQTVRRAFSAERLCFYDEETLEGERRAWLDGDPVLAGTVGALLHAAEQALLIRRLSVVDKATVPPTGDVRDYWSVAPYWWADPEKPDGMPSVRRDEVRRPEADPTHPAFLQSDRGRLQLFLDSVTILALAWYFTREDRFAEHAAELLRTWFVKPETRMNPHLRYAQVRPGHGEEGKSTGIVEARDLSHALDAVRLVVRSGALDQGEAALIGAWQREFWDWLRKSKQGRLAARRENNLGTAYELLVCAIAMFLGEARFVRPQLQVAKMRIAAQIEPDGLQPLEAARSQSLHYELFNLQLWANLARMARAVDVDLWRFETRDGCGLKAAFAQLTERFRQPVAEALFTEAERQRFAVIAAFAPWTGDAKPARAAMYKFPPHLNSDTSVSPFWLLGLRDWP